MIVIWEFLTSKVGRYLAIIGGAALVIGAALLKAFSAGKATEKAHAQREQIDAVQDAHEIHGDVSRLPPSAVDSELRKWSH